MTTPDATIQQILDGVNALAESRNEAQQKAKQAEERAEDLRTRFEKVAQYLKDQHAQLTLIVDQPEGDPEQATARKQDQQVQDARHELNDALKAAKSGEPTDPTVVENAERVAEQAAGTLSTLEASVKKLKETVKEHDDLLTQIRGSLRLDPKTSKATRLDTIEQAIQEVAANAATKADVDASIGHLTAHADRQEEWRAYFDRRLNELKDRRVRERATIAGVVIGIFAGVFASLLLTLIMPTIFAVVLGFGLGLIAGGAVYYFGGPKINRRNTTPQQQNPGNDAPRVDTPTVTPSGSAAGHAQPLRSVRDNTQNVA
jgi:hypothetical protein